jgi:serine protease Do
MIHRTHLLLAAFAMLVPMGALRAQVDVNEETEKAMKAAVGRVAPSVVLIETSGGQDTIVWTDRSTGAPIRKVIGPTTGLIVDPDGYIVSSSFNFINKPTDIRVTVPGKGRSLAKVVATDQSRMITLLKIDLKGLPVPQAFPKKETEVGMWTLALGRTLNPNVEQPPSVSAGIVSAVGRIWGKAFQTDAKVSPNNYGGPMVGIDGRVMGVLVPASHQSEGENAGVEWYDSGIGFAIPLEDINRVLPKLKTGTPEKQVNLRGGLLGIPQPQPAQYLAAPTLTQVLPESAAEKAGLKSGDLIISVDGKPIYTMAQFLHSFKPLYEGDSFSVKLKRADKEVDIAKVTLQGVQTAIEPGFLGILPMRDDPEPGVEVRYVYPTSPAAKAGIKVGDRIMKVGGTVGKQPPAPVTSRDRLIQAMSAFTANTDIQIELKRKDGGKTETVTAHLVAFTEDVPDELPKESSKKKALEKSKRPDPKVPPKKGDPKEEPKKEEPKKEEPPKKGEKIETGLMQRTNAALGRKYWVFVPQTYDPNVAHGLLVWLHPAGREGRDAQDMVDIWDNNYCEEHNLIMIGPISENKNGWVATETEGVISDINAVLGQYTIDRQRIVAHGSGIGGQMAYYLGFNARDQIRGVATVGAVLASQPKDLIANQRLQFIIYAGAKDPIVRDITESKPKLTERKYNVILRILQERGKEYLNEEPKALKELVRWIDSLDRI